jgi:hypothetical protein
MANTLVYNIVPPVLPQPLLINLNRQPDINGKTLPRGSIPTSVMYVRNFISDAGDIISFFLSNISSVEQQQNDARLTANPQGVFGAPVLVNGVFQSTITDLLPAPFSPDLPEPSIIATTSERIKWDIVLSIDHMTPASPPGGKITIQYEPFTDPLPTAVPTDPRATEPYPILGSLQYTVASFPFAVSIGATPDDFGRIAPRGSWPNEIQWNGDLNDVITGHAIGSITTSLRQIPLITSHQVIIDKKSAAFNNGYTFIQLDLTFINPPDIKKAESTWSSSLASIEHCIRVESVGPIIGTKLLVQLAAIPDVYREYISFVPTL